MESEGYWVQIPQRRVWLCTPRGCREERWSTLPSKPGLGEGKGRGRRTVLQRRRSAAQREQGGKSPDPGSRTRVHQTLKECNRPSRASRGFLCEPCQACPDAGTPGSAAQDLPGAAGQTGSTLRWFPPRPARARSWKPLASTRINSDSQRLECAAALRIPEQKAMVRARAVRPTPVGSDLLLFAALSGQGSRGAQIHDH